jgi:hypothetical protein
VVFFGSEYDENSNLVEGTISWQKKKT